MLTTFYSCGAVAPRRQGDIIKELASPRRRVPDNADELADALVRAMRRGGLTVS